MLVKPINNIYYKIKKKLIFDLYKLCYAKCINER